MRGGYMKEPFRDKKIETIPKGVYEGGLINKQLHDKKTSAEEECSKDLQNNGYVINNTSKRNKT